MMMSTRSGIFLLLIALGLGACGLDPANQDALRIGEKAPSLRTKTLADVKGDFSRITSYRYPDERMYQLSLDQALKTGKPLLVEFATPGHCTTCDGQLQMVKDLLNRYEGKLLFLHMDQYQNPEAFIAYKVRGDPWTILIDENQVVRFKRPGRMLYGEFEIAIQELLKDTS